MTKIEISARDAQSKTSPEILRLAVARYFLDTQAIPACVFCSELRYSDLITYPGKDSYIQCADGLSYGPAVLNLLFFAASIPVKPSLALGSENSFGFLAEAP